MRRPGRQYFDPEWEEGSRGSDGKQPEKVSITATLAGDSWFGLRNNSDGEDVLIWFKGKKMLCVDGRIR